MKLSGNRLEAIHVAILQTGRYGHMGKAGVWDFCFPVKATVLSTTAKRVKISAHDPDERGEGMVVRYVSPDSLNPDRS